MVSVTSTKSDGMNGIPEGQTRVTVSVDVVTTQLKATRNALMATASEYEAEEAGEDVA